MAYIHKKFKKLASSETPAPEVIPEQQRAASPLVPDPGPLKHSVGSMVDQHEQLQQDAEAEGRKNICPYCKVACPKPSVLEKHIRTHTNERPFPCDACGFAFKTKSNLTKQDIENLTDGPEIGVFDMPLQLKTNPNCFLDTQVSLAPTHVSPSVCWLVIL